MKTRGDYEEAVKDFISNGLLFKAQSAAQMAGRALTLEELEAVAKACEEKGDTDRRDVALHLARKRRG